MYLGYCLIKIGEFLKPKPSADPLAKNTGYGWGWLFILSYIGWGIESAQGKTSPNLIMELICFPIFLIIYFRIRKRSIEKRTYGNTLWIASFIAGLITVLIGAGFIFLITFIFSKFLK